MLRRVLVASLLSVSVAASLASLSATSFALDVKPKAAESAFTAKTHPDILGVSTEATADAALALLEAAFKGRAGTKADIQKQKSGGHIAALTFDGPTASKQGGEVVAAGFSAP